MSLHCHNKEAVGSLNIVMPSSSQPLPQLVLQAYGAAAVEVNVRDAFVAPAGWVLLAADYSQIELRVLAHFCEDPNLCRLLSRRDGDAFCLIASQWLKRGVGAGR